MSKTRALLELINETGTAGIEHEALLLLALEQHQLDRNWCMAILNQRRNAGVIERDEDNRWRMVELDTFRRQGRARTEPQADEAAPPVEVEVEAEAGDELSVMVDLVGQSVVIEHDGGRLILSPERAHQLAALCAKASHALAA